MTDNNKSPGQVGTSDQIRASLSTKVEPHNTHLMTLEFKIEADTKGLKKGLPKLPWQKLAPGVETSNLMATMKDYVRSYEIAQELFKKDMHVTMDGYLLPKEYCPQDITPARLYLDETNRRILPGLKNALELKVDSSSKSRPLTITINEDDYSVRARGGYLYIAELNTEYRHRNKTLHTVSDPKDVTKDIDTPLGND